MYPYIFLRQRAIHDVGTSASQVCTSCVLASTGDLEQERWLYERLGGELEVRSHQRLKLVDTVWWYVFEGGEDHILRLVHKRKVDLVSKSGTIRSRIGTRLTVVSDDKHIYANDTLGGGSG
jgi:hypothetical protein